MGSQVGGGRIDDVRGARMGKGKVGEVRQGKLALFHVGIREALQPEFRWKMVEGS